MIALVCAFPFILKKRNNGSGSTIFYRGISFPLKNLPILKLTEAEERGGAGTLAAAIREKVKWFSDEGGLTQTALGLRGEKNPAYHRVQELAQGIFEGLEALREHGFFPVVVVEADMAKVLVGLARAGLLKMDIVSYPMWGSDVMATLADNAEFDSQSYTGHFRFGGLKMFLDGSPQGLTAWMTEPYVEGPDGEKDWVAYSTMTDEDAIAFAKMAIDSNHQLLCHCNGDAAADQLLRVYEAARDASDNPEKMALRPVMIHAQTARTDQYEKMAAIGMIPSIFSSHVWYWGDAHLRNLGPVRGGRVSACGDAERAGLPFTLHTDTPVLRPNLLEAAWCAVNRITKEMCIRDSSMATGS